MNITFNGDFTDGRELMKVKRQQLINEIKRLEKEHKKLEAYPPQSELNHLESIRSKLPFYSISKTVPVEFKDIIINGKLLKAFIKKLKGFQYQITTNEHRLKLEYGRKHGNWIGELELFNLSSYFKGFTDIPKMEVSYDFLD